jgi:hypothetical protein
MKACEEKTMALPEMMETCPVKTRACLEKKEGTKEQQQPLDGRLGHIEKGEGDAKPAANDAPTLSSRDIQEEVIQNGSEQIVDGEIETAAQTPEVEKSQEVPERATDEETSGGTEDRAGELRLAVRRHRQWKKRAQENGGPWQKFAAFRGRFTCRTVSALLKGPRRNRRSGIRGPGKTFRSRMEGRSLKQRQIKGNVARETPEGWTDKKRRRTRLECNSGIRRLSKTSGTTGGEEGPRNWTNVWKQKGCTMRSPGRAYVWRSRD